MIRDIGQKSGRHIDLFVAINRSLMTLKDRKSFSFAPRYRHIKQPSFFLVPFFVPIAESAVRKQTFFQSDNENIFLNSSPFDA